MKTDLDNQLVSVIIPVFRRPEQLSEALRSVLSQAYQPMEVIVVDDGSGDEWVGRYEIPPGVTLIAERENRGPSAARNAGLAVSRGEVIAWLDSDDVWLPGYLNAQVEQLNANPDADLAFCHAMMVDESLSPLAEQLEPIPIRDNPLPVVARKNVVRSPSCVVARRAAVERAGGYDESLKGAEDWDLWISMARFASFAYDPTPRILYRNHASQLSNFSLHRLTVDESVRVKWLRWAEGEAPQHVRVMRKALCRDLQRHASLYLQNGRDFPRALRTIAWAIRSYPLDVRNYTRFARVLLAPLGADYRRAAR